MDLLIMPYENAIKYTPSKKTYAIRIYSGDFLVQNLYKKSLKESENWLNISEYVFDDISLADYIEAKDKYILFNEEIANRIIEEFNQYRKEAEALLVHCYRGENRSPAVGIALNEIFRLGNDKEELIRSYPYANYFIYSTLIEAGRKFKRK